jgi:hypothetical protein
MWRKLCGVSSVLILLSGSVRAARVLEAKSKKTGASQLDSEGGWTIVVPCGVLMVENHGEVNFTMLIRDAKPTSSHSLWIVDGAIVTASTATADEMGVPNAKGVELLRAHASWELDFQARSHGWSKPQVSSDLLESSIPMSKAMFWAFDVPLPFKLLDRRITRMAYVTVAIKSLVLSVAVPMAVEDDPAAATKLIRSTLSTLKMSSKPIDVAAVSDRIRSRPQSWRGCGGGGSQN